VSNSMRITRGATINLGNYESARVEISQEVDLTEDDEGQPVFEALNDEVKARLAAEVEKVQEAAGLPPRPAERFTG